MGFDQLSTDYNDVVVRGVLDLEWRGTHWKSEFAYRISENDGTFFEFYNPRLQSMYDVILESFLEDKGGAADTYDEFIETFTPPFTHRDGYDEGHHDGYTEAVT